MMHGERFGSNTTEALTEAHSEARRDVYCAAVVPSMIEQTIPDCSISNNPSPILHSKEQ